MSKQTNGVTPRSVEQLRAELETLAQRYDEGDEKQREAEAGIAEESVRVFRNDKDAKERLKSHKQQQHGAVEAKRLIELARAQIGQELEEAIAAKEKVAREKDAAEAEEFAKTLPNLFRECDRHLVDFRRAYGNAVAAIRKARGRKWNAPSEELMTAKMIRAIKTAFSVSEVRALDMSPISPVERTTFAALGEGYAAGIIGGARQSLVPKPKPAPPPAQPQQQPQAAKPLPDVGMPLPGDKGSLLQDQTGFGKIGFEVRR